MEKLDLIIEKLERIDGSVQKLEGSVQRLESNVVELQAGQQRLEGSVQRIEGNVVELQAGQQRLEGSVIELQAGQQRLEGGQAALVTGLMETNQIVRAIRDRQVVTDAKLEAVTMDVNKLIGKVEGNSSKLDVVSADLLKFRRDTKNKFIQQAAFQHVVNTRLNSMEQRIELLENVE